MPITFKIQLGLIVEVASVPTDAKAQVEIVINQFSDFSSTSTAPNTMQHVDSVATALLSINSAAGEQYTYALKGLYFYEQKITSAQPQTYTGRISIKNDTGALFEFQLDADLSLFGGNFEANLRKIFTTTVNAVIDGSFRSPTNGKTYHFESFVPIANEQVPVVPPPSNLSVNVAVK